MRDEKTLKQYRATLREKLDDDFLHRAMDSFAVAYRASRRNAFAAMDQVRAVEEVVRAKDEAMVRSRALLEEFTLAARAAGAEVHVASTAEEANSIIADIARANGVGRVVKSKSMTAEETFLNHRLEAEGLEVTETDLGEWIIQLRGEGPSHMVMPAIHLSRGQVADLFSGVTGQEHEPDIEKLVKVARAELREKFFGADMGISGANFAIAETGTLGIVTNEGNARLVTTLPRIHVALVGLDKLVATVDDALNILKVLPRNATGQAITSYVTWITGAGEWGGGGDKRVHIVFLDNGRRELARDPELGQAMRCVRCGACANVCPVYRAVGGHAMGHVYIGAIGLVLTPFYHGPEAAKNLVKNCLGCGACREVCAAGIDLPRLITEVRARMNKDQGAAASDSLLSKVISNRALFHAMLRAAAKVQGPVTEGGYLRHLPMVFGTHQEFRAIPALAKKPFRTRWKKLKIKEPARPLARVALFAGCAQDFVYPEQLEAVLKVLSRRNVAVDFPMGQTCCGLPAVMMGEPDAAREAARTNLKAFMGRGPGTEPDYIVSACASCASHLGREMSGLLPGDALAERFAGKVMDFASFCKNVLNFGPSDFRRGQDRDRCAYHAPCHLCRGLGVREEPRRLIRDAGHEYAPGAEEELCCGFGGSYSFKLPEVSKRILSTKLKDVYATGAGILATDCPGCVMQLRGGDKASGNRLQVLHLAQVMAGRLK